MEKAEERKEMGFFDRFRRGSVEQPVREPEQIENELLEIVRIVSFGDEEILEKAREYIENTEGYCRKYSEDFVSMEEDVSLIRWNRCIDLLISHEDACVCDWKAEAEDFFFAVSSLRRIRYLSLKISEKWFQKELSVDKWCEVLDEKWKKQDCVMAAFDMDSDFYVMFPCRKNDFIRLSELADRTGQRIDLAGNM